MKKTKIYLTITGINHYLGRAAFSIGQLLTIVKEPDNPYDCEAIKVQLTSNITVGYVANSTYTVTAGTLSAGRVYDKIKNKAQVRVKFITKDSVIAKFVLVNKE